MEWMDRTRGIRNTIHQLLPLILSGLVAVGLYYVYWFFLEYTEPLSGVEKPANENNRRSLKAGVLTTINALPWVVYYYYHRWKKRNGND